MMTNRIGRLNIFCVVLFVVLVFSGCAGPGPRVGDASPQAGDTKPAGTVVAVVAAKPPAAVKPVEVAKTAERQEKQRVVVDDSGEFELIKTPFGYIKHRIKRTESRPAPPPPPVTASVPE
ncbi:MAG: hypothetical protein E4H15_04675, partial [Syntrophobacterales bacterium]